MTAATRSRAAPPEPQATAVLADSGAAKVAHTLRAAERATVTRRASAVGRVEGRKAESLGRTAADGGDSDLCDVSDKRD
ncbi:hypothetical protein GT034_01350 [Streptomyces sp. SID2563]|nr:hypothetical protein [Streptomyces sp. SID2563]